MHNGSYLNKTVLVWGIGGKTGKSIAAFLKAKGAQVLVGDDNINALTDLNKDYLVLKDIENCNWQNLSVLCVVPGLPSDHKVISLAKRYGFDYNNVFKPITSDIQLFFDEYARAKYMIGVTGTSGKSTTVALIHHILSNLLIFPEEKLEVIGNIGVPVLETELESGISIIEISSAQAEGIRFSKLNVAVLINVTPNHLDRYDMDIQKYISAKKRIFGNENTTAIVLLNNKLNIQIFNELNNKIKIPCFLNSLENRGYSFLHETIYRDGKKLGIFPTNCLENVVIDNIVIAYAVVDYTLPTLNHFISHNDIVKALNNFCPLEHRSEKIGEWHNITFINDSKATTVEATNKALNRFTNIYWIAGGKKTPGNEFDALTIQNVKEAFFIGVASDELATTFTNRLNFIQAFNLHTAFKTAVKKALKASGKKIILLSPACASLDQWTNFEERGKYFKQLCFDIMSTTQ